MKNKLYVEDAVTMKNPTYLTWLVEQKALELIEEEELEQQNAIENAKWLEYDAQIQQKWMEKQEKLAEIEKAKQLEKQKIQKVNYSSLNTSFFFKYFSCLFRRNLKQQNNE